MSTPPCPRSAFGTTWARDAQSVLDRGFNRLIDAPMAIGDLVGLANRCPIDSGSERVRYLADKVIPEVTNRLASDRIPEGLTT